MKKILDKERYMWDDTPMDKEHIRDVDVDPELELPPEVQAFVDAHQEGRRTEVKSADPGDAPAQ